MKKRWSILLAFVLLLSLLCGCGSKSETADNAPATGGNFKAEAAEAPSNTGVAFDDVVKNEMGVSYAPLAPAEPSDGQRMSAGLPENVKIIYTADIDMESTAFDATVRGIDELVASMGGYFENSSLENYNSNYRTGNYTVRVPAAQFDAFCNGVGGLCQVNSISRNAQDVSEAYYDMESRLATQRTKLERLQALLAKAENMENIISLETAISDTELAIEQLTGSLRKYDSLVGYATVHIYLREVYQLTEQEQPVIGFGAKLAAAFQSGCSGFVNGLQRAMLSVARNWVGWLIFIVIVAVAIAIPLRIVRKKQTVRAQRQDGEDKDE